MTLFIFAVLLLCALSAMVLWPVLTLAALPLTGVALALVVAVAGGIGVPALLLARRRPQRSAQHVSLAAEREVLASYIDHAFRPALLVSGNNVLRANLALLKELGMSGSGDDIIGMPFENIVHPRDQQRVPQILEQRDGHDEVLTLLRADGSSSRLHVSVFPGAHPTLRMLQLSGTHADGERSMQPSNGTWPHKLAARLGDVLFALDDELAVAYISPAWSMVAGAASANATGTPLLQLLHPEDRAAVTQALREAVRNSSAATPVEARVLNAQGPLCWMEIRARALPPAADDSRPGAVIGVMIDVTQRKLNEESLRAQRRSLRTLVDNVPGMIYRGHSDRRWSMEFISEGCLELTGYPPTALMGNGPVGFGDLIHPEDREYVWTSVQMRTGRGEGFELTYKIIDRGGNVKWVAEIGRGIFSASGELLGLEGLITDFSSRQRVQEDARRRLIYESTTGLMNHSVLLDRLAFTFAHATANGYRFAVAYLCFGGPQSLAQEHGPADADRLMIELGKRLKVLHTDCNGIGRHDDAGFVCLLTDFTFGAGPQSTAAASPDESQVEQRLGRLLEGIGMPVRLDHREFVLRMHWSLVWHDAGGHRLPAQMIEEAIDMTTAQLHALSG